MKRLIKTDFFKLAKSEPYRRIWVATVCVTLFSLCFDRGDGGSFGIKGFDWLCRERLSINWLLIIICIFTADYVAGEFENRTYISALVYGYTQRQVYWAELTGYLAGMTILLLTNTVVGTLIRTLINEFGAELNEANIVRMARSEVYYVLICFVHGAIPFLFAMIAKSRAGTIGLGAGVNQMLGSLTANLPYKLAGMENSACFKFY